MKSTLLSAEDKLKCKCSVLESASFVDIFRNNFGVVGHEYLVNIEGGIVKKLPFSSPAGSNKCDLGYSSLEIVRKKNEKYGTASAVIDLERTVDVSIIISQEKKFFLLNITKTAAIDGGDPSPVRIMYVSMKEIDLCSGKILDEAGIEDKYLYFNLKSTGAKRINRELMASAFNPEVISQITGSSSKMGKYCQKESDLLASFQNYLNKRKLLFPYFKKPSAVFEKYKTKNGSECIIRRFEYSNPAGFDKNVF